MPANPDDLVMSFDTPNGAHVEIYDTYCKNFTQEDKDRQTPNSTRSSIARRCAR